MSKKYRHSKGKRVYYFYHGRQEMLSGTIYRHYTELAGEMYLITPDNVTKAEIKNNERVKIFRKKVFGEIYKEPVTHVIDIEYIRTHTQKGLQSLKKEAKSFLERVYRDDFRHFLSREENYKKTIKDIEGYNE